MPRFLKTGASVRKRSAGRCPALSPRNNSFSLGASSAHSSGTTSSASTHSRSRRDDRTADLRVAFLHGGDGFGQMTHDPRHCPLMLLGHGADDLTVGVGGT